MASVTDPRSSYTYVERHDINTIHGPDIAEMLLHSWAAYLNEKPRVITAALKEMYLDIPNCPFTPNLSLKDALESGFNGMTSKMELVEFCDTSSQANKAAFVDGQAYIAQSEDKSTITISFRGSESVNDFLINFTTTKTRWEPSEDDAKGHAGFLACLDCLRTKNKPMVHLGWYNVYLAFNKFTEKFRRMALDPKVRCIQFAGHSQGGALAVMALVDFLECTKHHQKSFIKNKIQIKLFTIGQPRVGDDAFVQHVFRECTPLANEGLLHVYRVVTSGDPIQTFPPIATGYFHFALPIVFQNETEIIKGNKHAKGKITIDLDEERVISDEAVLKKAGVTDVHEHFDSESPNPISLATDDTAYYSHKTNTYFQCYKLCENHLTPNEFKESELEQKMSEARASMGVKPGMQKHKSLLNVEKMTKDKK